MVEELTADFVAVGLGVAGLGGALAAAELGASVIVIEQQPSDRHTPSFRMSGGIIMGVTDVGRATTYLDRCAGGLTPLAVSRAWAERASTVIGWLNELCPALRLTPMGGPEYPSFEGAEAIVAYRQGAHRDGTPFTPGGGAPDEGGVRGQLEDASGRRQTSRAAMGLDAALGRQLRTGFEFYAQLRRVLERRENVRVIWDAPAERLERSGNGDVTGVVARTPHGALRIRSRNGVLLATGGYENDEELKRQYLRAYPTYFYGNPGNAGAGVRMAQAVGADLWHMTLMIGRGVSHFVREDGSTLDISLALDGGGYVITDKRGHRYFNEYRQATADHDVYYDMVAFEPAGSDFPRIPSFYVFDERRRAFGPMVPSGVGPVMVGLCDWSADNQREIERGWIKRGHTLEEVATAAGVDDPEALAHTVREYNRACADGRDRFGRPKQSLIPIDQPPFYAVVLYPGGSNTCGGPRRDEHARIVDVFGRPIPGLYGAGSLGEAMGRLYPAWGCNLSDGICFGQIAAEHALSASDT